VKKKKLPPAGIELELPGCKLMVVLKKLSLYVQVCEREISKSFKIKIREVSLYIFTKFGNFEVSYLVRSKVNVLGCSSFKRGTVRKHVTKLLSFAHFRN